jgi:SAM-dependent methyltransferase
MKVLPQTRLNCFLKTRKEVDECTNILTSSGLISHAMTCKNWDIAKIIPYIEDGNILDMGSAGSSILENVLRIGRIGLKYGIDISYPNNYELESGELKYFRGDLMKTEFSDGLFDYLTCLSVIEHEVDYDLLAKECNRLLKINGRLFITFDYWEPKVDTSDVGNALYGLKWNILDRNDVIALISALDNNGLTLDGEIDWTIQDRVINDKFYAPYGKSYTFGIIMVIKK